ncbi:WXG100 family type VII secretion target [Demequina sp. NBRC 110054]|uniref:WXG100 family type VII secretion target n=1 Tax=Demequina sp. NBRC 110054 TaxID=1570343 RepID=UPI0009FC600F|nr:WXG100 family type VII secretion target [Demequina sp. NBRC 110054]
MANITVTYDEIRAAADQLLSGQGDIDSRLAELKAFIDSLVSGGYVTSSSSGAFHEQYTAFTTSSQQAISALEGLSQFLRGAADTLQQTDEALASAIRGR